jgi:S1-C subfamily serine protease
MRGESSEQRRGSATITSFDGPWGTGDPWGPRGGLGARLGRLQARARAAGLLLLVGTALACSTWTGSVGAVLAKDNLSGRLFVRETPAGMGAARAGLAVGDEVVAIEGKPVATMTPPEVHEALAGKVGTKVKVTVVRAGSTLEVVVERGPLAGT